MPATLNEPLHIRTPLWKSLPIRSATGKHVYLKMECFQRTGSFKNRGVGKLCQHYVRDGKTHLVSSSGGNAGYTTAFAGRKLGVKVTVFVPRTAKQLFIDKIEEQGSTVIVHGSSIDEAKTAALALVEKEENAAFITPFDHPIIWEGNATMMDEIVQQMGVKPDAIVASVGGGGLACGLLKGMHKHGWGDVPLFGVETVGAASFAATVKAGKLVTLDKIDSIAVTLGLQTVAQELFDWTKKHSVTPITVTDKQAVDATKRFLDDHRILLEPSCAVTCAALYDEVPELKDFKRVLIILCGGIGISFDLLTEYLATV